MGEMPFSRILVIICFISSVVVCSCGDDKEAGFSGIVGTSSGGPDPIGPEDPDDWQPRCDGSYASEFCFWPAYPNPTAGGTQLPFWLADSSEVDLHVESAPHRTVRTIGPFSVPSENQQPFPSGGWISEVFWDLKDDAGDDLPNGIYRVWIKATRGSDGAKSTSFGDVQIQRR